MRMASLRLSTRQQDYGAAIREWSADLTERRLFAVVVLPIFAIYLVTATWSYPLINDVFTNAITAWNLGNHGSVYLEEHEQLEDYSGTFAWVIPAGESVVSKYPPGAPLLAAPLYAVWPEDPGSITYTIPEQLREADRADGLTVLTPPVAPAAITSALATALAIGFLAVAFVRVGGTPLMSLLAAYLAGLGTSAWEVASGQLWQHGPAMLWIALALVLSDRQMVGSGFAYGAAILTRPPLAVIAASSGLFRALKSRSLRPAVMVGIGALAGLLLFMAYNWWLFGNPSVSAGYGTVFQDRVADGVGGDFFRNLFLAAFALDWGVFVWSPFLLVLLPGIRSGWKAAPSWARGAALGGVLYLLLQYQANRSSGGSFLGYRYPLEALTAAAPVLFLAFKEGLAQRQSLKPAFAFAVLVSVLLHGFAAFDVAVF